MAFSLVLCMLLAGCGNSNVSEEETTEVNSDTDGVRQITLKQSTIVPILLNDTVAATSDDVNNILENLGEYDSTLIKKSAGILEDESKLTRYQVAAIASNMIEQQSATPDMTWYQIDYTDNSEIPDNYVQDICIVDKAGVMQYDDEFNGYSNVSKEELQSIIDKTLEFILTAPKDQNYNTSDEEDDEIGIGVGEEVHREVYEDKLNGASVAVVKEPKTTGELNLNIKSVSKLKLGDMLDNFIDENGIVQDVSNNVDVEYINLDQALVDWGNIDTTNIVGVTITEPYKFKLYDNGFGEQWITGEVLAEKLYGIFNSVVNVVVVNDNKVIAYGDMDRDAGSNGDIRITSGTVDEYDYLGMIIDKQNIEGSSIVNDNNNKILLLIPKLGVRE